MTILSKDTPAEIHHPAHPEHKLKLVASTGNAQFQCNGCHELGAGARYRCPCRTCDFELHEDCALAEDTLVHPLFEDTTFVLHHEPPRENRLCDACGRKVLGFYYHCSREQQDLHPCCAKLPTAIQFEELTFLLLEELHPCNRCGGEDSWFYRSTCKTVYLHVGCVKEVALQNLAGGRSSTDDNRLVPFVRETALKKYGGEGARGKFERICEMVAAVVRIIIAATIGDPTLFSDSA